MKDINALQKAFDANLASRVLTDAEIKSDNDYQLRTRGFSPSLAEEWYQANREGLAANIKAQISMQLQPLFNGEKEMSPAEIDRQLARSASTPVPSSQETRRTLRIEMLNFLKTELQRD